MDISPALLNTHGLTLLKAVVLNKCYCLACMLGYYEFKIHNETSFLYEPKPKDWSQTTTVYWEMFAFWETFASNSVPIHQERLLIYLWKYTHFALPIHKSQHDQYDRLADKKLVSLHYNQIYLLFAWSLISTAEEFWLKLSHLKKQPKWWHAIIAKSVWAESSFLNREHITKCLEKTSTFN